VAFLALVGTATLATGAARGAGSANQVAQGVVTATDGAASGVKIKEYPLPAGSDAFGISPGRGPYVWFTEPDANKIGQMTASGRVTEFAIPTRGSDPLGIATDQKGNAWFTEGDKARVGRVTPAGAFSEFRLPPHVEPFDLAAGADGNMWFTDLHGREKVGRMTPSGTVRRFDGATGAYSVEQGPDGDIWYAGYGFIGRITLEGQVKKVVWIHRTHEGTLSDLAAGPDGNVWFGVGCEDTKIGRITPELGVRTWVAPAWRTTGSCIQGMTTGPDGRLWFTEGSGDRIGRVTTSGAIREFALPAGSHPQGISEGPGDCLWFTEPDAIGRICP